MDWFSWLWLERSGSQEMTGVIGSRVLIRGLETQSPVNQPTNSANPSTQLCQRAWPGQASTDHQHIYQNINKMQKFLWRNQSLFHILKIWRYFVLTVKVQTFSYKQQASYKSFPLKLSLDNSGKRLKDLIFETAFRHFQLLDL